MIAKTKKVITPLKGKVIVEPVELKKEYGSIIIPEVSKSKIQEGKIISISNEKIGSKGDRILFFKDMSTKMTYEGKECIVLNEEDILCFTYVWSVEKKGEIKKGLEIDKMLFEWVFVEAIEDPYEVKGIKIPDTAVDVVTKGIVVSIGPDGDSNIKLNDKVLFKRRSSFSRVEIGGKNLLVFKKNRILGILFGDNAEDVNPLSDNIFVLWEQASNTYGGTSLLRPETFKEMHHTGIVKEVGPDCKQLKVGDRIFFDQYCGVEKFEEEGNRYAFIKECDAYCVVPKRKEG